ncbi:unnamed protein product, partial [Tilletia laevis]
EEDLEEEEGSELSDEEYEYEHAGKGKGRAKEEDAGKGKGGGRKPVPAFMKTTRFYPNEEALKHITEATWQQLEQVRKPSTWADMPEARRAQATTTLIETLDTILRPYIAVAAVGSKLGAGRIAEVEVNGRHYGLFFKHLTQTNPKRANRLKPIFTNLKHSPNVPKETRQMLTREVCVERIVRAGGTFNPFIGIGVGAGTVRLTRNMTTVMKQEKSREAAMRIGADFWRGWEDLGWSKSVKEQILSNPRKYVVLDGRRIIPVLQAIVDKAPPDWIRISQTGDTQYDYKYNMAALNSSPFWDSKRLDRASARASNTHPLLEYGSTMKLPTPAESRMDCPQYRIFTLLVQLRAIDSAQAGDQRCLPSAQPSAKSVEQLQLPSAAIQAASGGSVGNIARGGGVSNNLPKRIVEELAPALSGLPSAAAIKAILQQNSSSSINPSNWQAIYPRDMEEISSSVDTYRESMRVFTPGIQGCLGAAHRNLQHRTAFWTINHPDVDAQREEDKASAAKVALAYQQTNQEYAANELGSSGPLGLKRAAEVKKQAQHIYDANADLDRVLTVGGHQDRIAQD